MGEYILKNAEFIMTDAEVHKKRKRMIERESIEDMIKNTGYNSVVEEPFEICSTEC